MLYATAHENYINYRETKRIFVSHNIFIMLLIVNVAILLMFFCAMQCIGEKYNSLPFLYQLMLGVIVLGISLMAIFSGMRLYSNLRDYGEINSHKRGFFIGMIVFWSITFSVIVSLCIFYFYKKHNKKTDTEFYINSIELLNEQNKYNNILCTMIYSIIIFFIVSMYCTIYYIILNNNIKEFDRNMIMLIEMLQDNNLAIFHEDIKKLIIKIITSEEMTLRKMAEKINAPSIFQMISRFITVIKTNNNEQNLKFFENFNVILSEL